MERSRSEIDVLSRERNVVRNRLRREKNPKTIEELKSKRNVLTEKICSIRKDLKTANFTLERSDEVQDKIRIEQEYCRCDHTKHFDRKRKGRNLGR